MHALNAVFLKGVKPDRKPSSVPPAGHPEGGDDHSSGTAVACGLKRHNPRTSGGPPLNVLLFGLAPDGVYHAFPVTREAVSSYLAFSPLPAMAGGIFSVALSLGLPPVAVSDHPALRSSDFPPVRIHPDQRSSDLLQHPYPCSLHIIKRELCIIGEKWFASGE
jgi:hypothetical protein